MSDRIRALADGFFVAPQIAEKDIADAAAMGVRLVICNRPDGEEPGQIATAALERAAKAAGLDFVAIPVRMDAIEDWHVARFAEAMAMAKGPILAYCRSGTRSTVLRAMVLAKRGAPVGAILAEAGALGYDLSPLAPRLEALAANSER